MFHCHNRWDRRYAYAQAGRSRPFYESRRHGRGSFGVRRPLRYLSYHLNLDDTQMRRIATVLDRLKTEREQAKLDESRTVSDLAGLVTKDDLSIGMLKEALAPRVETAERLQLAVARAVQDIVRELDPDQREEFAYLLTSKVLVL